MIIWRKLVVFEENLEMLISYNSEDKNTAKFKFLSIHLRNDVWELSEFTIKNFYYEKDLEQ